MRGNYGKQWIGYVPRQPGVDCWTPYGHVRPVSEMSRDDQYGLAGLLAMTIVLTAAAPLTSKIIGSFSGKRLEKRLQADFPSAKARYR